jgi:nitrite reductase/ring-hydroxylating ferredoxin subunit
VALMVHILLVNVYYQTSSNAIYAYQVRCMHVHAVTPEHGFTAKSCKGEKRVPVASKLGPTS